jgi:hypothetical protein
MPSWPAHAKLDTAKLQREVETLSLPLLKANAELRMKTIYASRLEVLVQERCAVIDALRGRIDQLRDQNRKLESEAEHYADMVRLLPQLVAAMLSPK